MPLQNRVTPTGTIIADPGRGLVMGNRGCLHNDERQVVRQYRVRQWIICRLVFKGRRRTLMTPREYTELFFLDEATALAAGHRPCAECNRERFLAFRRSWLTANPEYATVGVSPTQTIDDQLHRERISAHYYQRDKVKVTYEERTDYLPDGTFITYGQMAKPHLVYSGSLYPWSPAGYHPAIARPTGIDITVLTPKSTVRALAEGYQPCIHPSAAEASLKGSGACEHWGV